MLHFQRWKQILVILTCVLGFLYASPNVYSPDTIKWIQTHMPSWFPSETVNLGLDLRGGSHLLLEADTSVILQERLDSMIDNARSELRKKNIGYVNLVIKGKGITFKLRDGDKDRDAAYKIARELDQKAEVVMGKDGQVDVIFGDVALNEVATSAVGQSIEIVRRRIDETGTKEPIIQRQGQNRIVVQLPGVDDPEHIKNIIGKTAKMSFHLVDETMQDNLGSQKLPMRDDHNRRINVKKRVIISGDMLVDAQATFQQNDPVVSFKFNAIGSKKFCDVTKENVDKPFAIVLDDEVISAPVIRDAICGGSGVISGRFTVKDANDLALLLRAGALPAPLKVVEERNVGPTLGSDSIQQGKVSAMVATVMVFVFMFYFYKFFGIFANVALIFNIVFIFALLSMLQATLTLPGIAGIILTIGMAVDANVLVYERIKEELREGKTVMMAVDAGYKMSLPSIIDANLTTLIVAMILFSFGTGPVKGFAVTMCVGTVTSVFSAIMLTRFFVVTWMKIKKPTRLSI